MVRSLARVRLRLPIIFRWKDGAGVHAGLGVTRDMTAKGMFVDVTESECPPTSVILRCDLLVPSLDEKEPNAVIEAVSVGRVVRNEKGGFAVRNKRFMLREPAI
jgi:hypothetical protein